MPKFQLKLIYFLSSNFEMFSFANPELAINMSQEAWQTTYMLTGNNTVSAIANATAYITPNDTWTCSLEDDLNNVSILSSGSLLKKVVC